MTNRPRQRNRRLIRLVTEAQRPLRAINAQRNLDRRIRRIHIAELDAVNRDRLILITGLRLRNLFTRIRVVMRVHLDHGRIVNRIHRHLRRSINRRRRRRLVIRDLIRELDITIEVLRRRKRPRLDTVNRHGGAQIPAVRTRIRQVLNRQVRIVRIHIIRSRQESRLRDYNRIILIRRHRHRARRRRIVDLSHRDRDRLNAQLCITVIRIQNLDLKAARTRHILIAQIRQTATTVRAGL